MVRLRAKPGLYGVAVSLPQHDCFINPPDWQCPGFEALQRDYYERITGGRNCIKFCALLPNTHISLTDEVVCAIALNNFLRGFHMHNGVGFTLLRASHPDLNPSGFFW